VGEVAKAADHIPVPARETGSAAIAEPLEKRQARPLHRQVFAVHQGRTAAAPVPLRPPASPAASPLPANGQAAQIERAEYRALRLFLCSPVCRDPLAVLVIGNDLYRRAQQGLVQVHQRISGPIPSALDDPLPQSVQAICPQLEPHLGQLLERLCSLDPGVRNTLFRQPEGEMMAILDVLEPVG